MPSPSGDTAAYWRKHADEVRMRAEDMTDASAKGLMRGVANNYEKIATVYDRLAELTQHGPNALGATPHADNARHGRHIDPEFSTT